MFVSFAFSKGYKKVPEFNVIISKMQRTAEYVCEKGKSKRTLKLVATEYLLLVYSFIDNAEVWRSVANLTN